MSRLLSESVRVARVLAVDRGQLAWISRSGTGAPKIAVCSHRDPLAGAAQDTFGPMKPGFVDVIAGNDVAYHWMQTPPTSVASFAELRQVAQARCAHLYGGLPADWRIGADWQVGRPFVCVALPNEAILQVEQRLAEFKLVPRWHSAWGVLNCGLSHAFPSDGWSAVRSPARVILWHCSQARIDCMASWPVDAQEGSASAARRASQQVLLEMARSAHSGDYTLHWLDLVSDRAVLSSELTGVVPTQPDGRLLEMTAERPSEAATSLALRVLLGGIGA